MNSTIALNTENCKNVSTVINIEHPEWGTFRFNYRAQPLNDGEYAHTVGTGANSKVVFDSDFKYWSVAEFK